MYVRFAVAWARLPSSHVRPRSCRGACTPVRGGVRRLGLDGGLQGVWAKTLSLRPAASVPAPGGAGKRGPAQDVCVLPCMRSAMHAGAGVGCCQEV